MSIKLKLNLTNEQIHHLHQQKTVQIRNDQIGTGHEYNLNESNGKKIVKALKNGTGVRLNFSETEIHGSGVFGKRADKFFEKKGIKKTMYKVGSALIH